MVDALLPSKESKTSGYKSRSAFGVVPVYRSVRCKHRRYLQPPGISSSPPAANGLMLHVRFTRSERSGDIFRLLPHSACQNPVRKSALLVTNPFCKVECHLNIFLFSSPVPWTVLHPRSARPCAFIRKACCSGFPDQFNRSFRGHVFVVI